MGVDVCVKELLWAYCGNSEVVVKTVLPYSPNFFYMFDAYTGPQDP